MTSIYLYQDLERRPNDIYNEHGRERELVGE